MSDASVIEWIREKYTAIVGDLDERGRRRWAAAEARSLGWGGVTAVAFATGLSDRTIRTGIKELHNPDATPANRQRKIVPYGVYDITNNEAGVSVGISHDTAEFAVSAIRRWWQELGRQRFPKARRLLITADSGGSNSPRTRLWRWALQQFADETGLTIELCHYPPGTSKWNKIEHRLFCHITRNWQGIPLETREIVVQLIGSTKTAQGLEVHAWLDETTYEKSRKVSETDLATVRIKRNAIHGEWNYQILPRKTPMT